MQDSHLKKMPTGIASIDPVLEGGVPPGSVILLLGDLGAGSYEFTYSSVVNILGLMKGSLPENLVAPQEIRYITFTRIKDDVRQEILHSFHITGLEELVEAIKFDDLSELYFDNSVVPNEWYSQSTVINRLQKRATQDSLLVQLANAVNNATPGGLIILDSITDIATQSTVPHCWTNLAGFLRGLQRVAKQRGTTVYLLLSRGILESAQERELADIADAVLLFKWEESTGARRQRVMYFEKFRGVMPHLEEKDLVKFAVRISEAGGFEVSNIRVVI